MSQVFSQDHEAQASYSPGAHANMADQSQNHQPSRQSSNAYPSPHSYPSPVMQPQSYAYPPPGQTNQEPYRGSPPQNPNMSLPPLNLPPIRMPDGQTQQQPHPGAMGSPLPPPPHAMGQYYAHAGHPQGQPMMAPDARMLQQRYQLPPQPEQRVLSGGRHKKEIKRRTKTGCLTCRKRRIKCDEAHPVCRNCQKSKRECLGYDPIFKQQPGPAQIQPAPNSAPHQSSVPAPSPPVTAPYAGQVPQGYAPAVTAGYVPAVSASGSSHPHDNFNSSAIDPALAQADPAMQGQPPYNGAHALNPVLRTMGSGSPYPSDIPVIKAKPLNIADVFPIGSHQPPEISPRAEPISQELDDEFSKIFANDYCLGLDAVLETRWFSTNNNALHRILADKSLHEEAIHFVETVKYRQHSAEMAGIFSQEARLIWHMLAVCKHQTSATNGTNGVKSENAEEEDLALEEVRARFDILEALLTNQTLQSNPVQNLMYGADLLPAKKAELNFWHELGNFVLFSDQEPTPSGPVDYALTHMRNVLNGLETRDTLYSIAIARRLGNRIPGFPNSLSHLPPSQDPESELAKLQVAMSFISYECRSGTQQVTARICDMAMLSWTVSRR